MKRTSVFLAALALSLFTNVLVPAPDVLTPPAKPTLPPGTPAEQVRTLIQQYETAMAAVRKLYQAAKTEEEQEKLEALCPDARPYADLLVQIAEKKPNDAAAVDALIWAFRNTSAAKAKAILMRDHLLAPQIGPLCLELRHALGNAEATKALRKVLAHNPSKEAQAQAALALAISDRVNAALARKLRKADAKAFAKWESGYGKEVVCAIKKADTAALENEAEELLEQVRKTKAYPEVTIPFGEGEIKLGDLAGRELFEMRHLQPGKPAPVIVGEDINGKPMKLSDFRGKVVLLDFWGFW